MNNLNNYMPKTKDYLDASYIIKCLKYDMSYHVILHDFDDVLVYCEACLNKNITRGILKLILAWYNKRVCWEITH